MKTQFKSAPKGRVSTLVAALAVSSVSLFAQSATEAVTGFDDKGWSADDVRNSAGTNIVNDSTHAPVPGATLDPAAVAAQIYWTNSIGMFGNLGGVSLTGTTTGSGKSTISVLTGSADLAAGDFLSEDFRAIYRWQNTDTENASLAIKIGLRSTQWDDSQDGFTATRSGEAEWDLLLVADPTYNAPPGISPVNGQYITTVVDYSTAQFKLFNQAGNTYFNNTPLAEYIGGDANKQRTLAEWKLLDETVFGGVLFGSGAKIASTQFGFGSGNPNASGILDYAQISYLNEGQTIDFVEAQRYTGPSNEPANYGDSANWGGVSPSLNQNFIVDYDATLEVSGTQNTRSLGIIAGTTDLVLNAESSLVLNSAQNGTLSSAPGATLNVSGPGTLQGSVIETAGTTNFASTAFLDGGELPHPVRDGSGNSRYAMVVVGDGHLTLEDGADVTLVQAGKNVGVRVGEGLGVATLTIENGANLVIGNETDRGFFVVGDFGATGVFNQTGGEVSVVGAVNIGSQGGTGTWNFSKGTFNVGLSEDGTDSNGVSIGARRTGSNPAPTGTLNISGDAELILTRGYLLVGGDTSPTSGGTGVVNQNGGLVRIIKDGLALGSGQSGVAHGTYNLNNGVLEIGGTNGLQAGGTGGGTGIFNLGGGTLRVIESDLTTSVPLNLIDGTSSTINTNGLNATLTGGIVGTFSNAGGDLHKAGSGTLILNGGTYNGKDLKVDGGTIQQESGTVQFWYGSIGADGNTGTYVLNGGNFNPRDLNVGDFGGNGTFIQNGGTVQVASDRAINIGNRGGTGVYTITNGELYLNAYPSINILGRHAEGDGASVPSSHGTLNIGGGASVDLASTGVMILGSQVATPNNPSIAQGSTGTINQTGGTFTVNSGALLYLSAVGSGTYNLDGGFLEIGGGSLIPRYGSNNADYAFNLGGGTIRVIDSDLVTSAVPTLKAGTTSTIDTNGLNATFSGGFAGTGGFNKVGRGALTLGGETTVNADYSVQGDLAIGSGANDGILNIGDDGTLTINSVSGETGGNAVSRLIVGTNGAEGSLNIDGGSIAIHIASGAGSNRIQIGLDGGTGVATMTDGSIQYVPSPGTYGAFDLGRGDGSIGRFTQSGGVVDLAGGALQIGVLSGVGSYIVENDAELLLSGKTTLYVGHTAGGSGLIEIRNSAQFIQGTPESDAGQAYIGASGGAGKIWQTGANSVASIVTENVVHIGHGNGGSGIYQLDAGTLTMGGVDYGGVYIGESAGATGEFLQNGGTSRFVSNNVYAGYGGVGSFTLNNGTATIDKALVLGQLAGSTGTVNLGGGVLEIGGNNGIAKGAGSATFNLGGGTIRVIGKDLTTSVGMTLLDETTSTIDTNGFNATFTGVLYGDGGLTKTGIGKLTVTAENTYTGETRVTGGTLTVSGSIASSSLTTVQGGGILTGTGSVGALDIASGGVLSPGNSPGTLTAADTTWSGGGIYVWELNSALGSAGTNWDLLDVTETLTIQSTLANPFIVQIHSLDSTGQPGALEDFDPTQTYSWIIASAGNVAGFSSEAFSVNTSNFVNVPGSTRFSVTSDGTNIYLTYSAVPEPATYGAIIALGLLTLAAARRRRM